MAVRARFQIRLVQHSFCKSPVWHHYLHHRYPDKNFNVALLAGDYVFGTMAKASDADWQAMKTEGIA